MGHEVTTEQVIGIGESSGLSWLLCQQERN